MKKNCGVVAKSKRGSIWQTWRRAIALGCFLGAAILIVAPLSAGNAPRRRAAVIPIKGDITDLLARTIERRIGEARHDGANVLIFEMDTPGGLVTAAIDICRLIKNVPHDIETVAWVNPQAYSAGSMISVACKQIYMSPASAIGDCAPIVLDPSGGLQSVPAAERAKMESPVLQEFRESAAANGYDQLLCRAMVTVGEEVWWIQNTASGEKRFVNAADKKKLIDDAEKDGATWELVKSYTDPVTTQSRTAEQPIDRADTLLTMSQSEAVGYGLARGVAADSDELATALQLSAPPTRLEITGWEVFAVWLNSPLIRGLLLAIAIAGGYMEFNHPGAIAPGIVAFVALAIFVGAPYAAGLADVWTIVLLVIGLALIGVEVFVIPGFGVAGILGGVAVVVALIGTFVPRTPGAPAFTLPDLSNSWTAIRTGILVMSSSSIAAGIGVMSLMRYVRYLPWARTLVLNTPTGAQVAVPAAYDPGAFVGDVGVLVAAAKPLGQARFGQRIVDVSSQGQYIDAHTKVQVVAVDGTTIFVRPIDELNA